MFNADLHAKHSSVLLKQPRQMLHILCMSSSTKLLIQIIDNLDTVSS